MGNKIPCLHSTEDSPVKTSNNFNKKPVNGNFQDQIYPQTFKTNQIDPKKNQKPIIMEETKKEDPSAKSKNHSSEEKSNREIFKIMKN